MYLQIASFSMKINQDKTPRLVHSQTVVPSISIAERGELQIFGFGRNTVDDKDNPIILLDIEISSGQLVDQVIKLSATLHKNEKKRETSPDWYGPVSGHVQSSGKILMFASNLRLSAWTNKESLTSRCSVSAKKDEIPSGSAESSLFQQLANMDHNGPAVSPSDPSDRFSLKRPDSGVLIDGPANAYSW